MKWRSFGILAIMDAGAISQQQLAALAVKYGIRLILLFGSSVGGREHQESDIDLGILLDGPGPGLSTRVDLQHELQSLIPERKVDLAILNHADPLFLKKVTERCKLLHGNLSDLHSLKILSFRRYQDHKRYLQMERRYVSDLLSRIANRL